MVTSESFSKLFESTRAKVKQKKIFEGGHADERPQDTKNDIVKFIVQCFKNKSLSENKDKKSILNTYQASN